MTFAEPRTKLYLVVLAGAGEAPLKHLACALTSTYVASVLIVPPAGGLLEARTTKPLIDLAQSKNVAALIASDAELARTLGADGVHVPWSAGVAGNFALVRGSLEPNFIVGADAGRSRHDAMTMAETGADYVAFGIPDHVEDRARARERRLDLVEWWAEIVEVPVVAFDVDEPDEAATLAQAGADFIAIRLPASLTVAEIPDWIATFASAVTDPQSVA